MRVVITSDLHYFTTEPRILDLFSDLVADDNPDVIVIAGDVGESYVNPDAFKLCLGLFRKASPNADVVVVAGNHDLWVKKTAKESSLDLWNGGLKKRAEEVGAFYLENKNHTKDGVCFVGSMMHYDYSVRSRNVQAIMLSDEYYIHNKKDFINDDLYFRGLPPDKEFAAQMGAAFRERLQSAENDNSVRTIAVVTHVPCVSELLTFRPHYDFSCVYFGNISHQEFIKSCSKVHYVFSGHSHHEEQAVYENRIVMATIPSHYNMPRHAVVDIP